ncbi:MAG: long-chain fatty acid--CoA ligase [Myxococcota bacterium]
MSTNDTGDRATIERALLDWMSAPSAERDDARFERLALDLFRFQFGACAPYARLCTSLERTPDSVARVEDIPAVPTGAFKEFALRCFPEARTEKIFRTSGTSVERRGELHLDTLALYEASLLASLRRAFLTDLVGGAPEMRFLAPGPDAAPDSSLTHMFETLRRAEGAPASGFDLEDGRLDLRALEAAVARAREDDRPLVIAGTSFAFVHFLDDPATAGDGRWALPRGSRVMETGGFKGRSRTVPRDVLRADIATRFGLDERAVLNQYGMTELGSQFYDSTLVDPNGPRRKEGPPWTRVRFVDPESGRDVADGEVGMIVIHDLANSGSVAAIQTADLGRAILDEAGRSIGFDVIGREAGAEARGCSIATDVMLEASREEAAS